jgi:peptide/nickel transport system ATP-binding protein
VVDRVMVMYLGKVVEIGEGERVFSAPSHPYTAALLASMPKMDPDARTLEAPLAGDPPNPINPPSGCRFHTRCTFAEAVCTAREPLLTPVAASHDVACLMVQPGSGHSRSAGPSEAAA